MFGLPGLPEEFAAGVPRSDSAAFAAMAAMMDDLSETDQARFQPYLLRPTEPGSTFYWTARLRALSPTLSCGQPASRSTHCLPHVEGFGRPGRSI